MSAIICKYCKEKNASSKEHLIANSRLISINSFKERNETNDNIQKTYKKITCENCNNELGKYEEKEWYNLAYATIWKVLAGNINAAFKRQPDYLLKNTSISTIQFFEQQFLDIIKTEKIIPGNTFKFDFDPMNSALTNKFGLAVKSVVFKPVDENGKPIERVKIFSKDKGGGSNEGGYTVSTDETGKAELNILTRVELVRVVEEISTLTNLDTNEKRTFKTDFLIYVSFNSNSHRLIFILPLIHQINTSWSNARIQLKHRDFLKIIQENFTELKITGLNEYFKRDNYT